jgi:hypothetical protein
MQHTEEEKGTGQVLLKRLVDQRLPRLLEMKARVDRGEPLSEFDISYLESALQDARHNHRYVIYFPEYADIVGKVAQLYEQITSKALENQRAPKK